VLVLWFIGPASAAPVFDDASAAIAVEIGGYSDQVHGVGWLDYDGDGDLDLFHPNGAGMTAHLFRNDGGGRFVDVSVDAGLDLIGGNVGVLAADIDGDGATDLMLTGIGVMFPVSTPPRLLQNRGDGTFADVTEVAGLLDALPDGSMAATAADVDADGDLDLYVTVPGSLRRAVTATNVLLINDAGRFVDETLARGLQPDRYGCVAMFVHLDDDTAIDLLAGTCMAALPDELRTYHNDGEGHFADAAVDARLWAKGWWMGLAAADFDHNGRTDLFATSNGGPDALPPVLYLQRATEYTESAEVAGVDTTLFGWGATAADFDGDGEDDLLEVGGGGPRLVQDRTMSYGSLLVGRGDGTFVDGDLGVDLAGVPMSGVAAADYDDDGAPDLAIGGSADPFTMAHGHPVLLHNRGPAGRWLTVRLSDAGSANRAAIGARIRVRSGERVTERQVLAGSSFASTESPWPSFALGDADAAEVCVVWPDGGVEGFEADVDRTVDLVRSAGVAEAAWCTEAAPRAGGPASGCSCAPTEPESLGGLVLLALVRPRRVRDA
jgi:hypothetical protein